MPPRMKNISAGSNVAERITILLVSPDKNDGDALLGALGSNEWLIHQCHNVSDALARLSYRCEFRPEFIFSIHQ